MNDNTQGQQAASTTGGRLQGKICVVTGGGSGIGKSVAMLAADEGGTVAVWDYDQTNAEAVAAQIGRAATASRVDVAVEADVDAAMAQVVERYGRVDVLFNVAGVGDNWTPLEDLDRKIWSRVIETNVWGVAMVSARALPEMLRAGKGAIVNISSVAAHRGGGGGVAYTASKGAVSSMTREMAFELGSRGIRVNAVSPGATATNMHQTASATHGPDFTAGGTALLDHAIKVTIDNTPLGRLGNPDEIANVAVFLASDEASFVTGSDFIADGGMCTHV